MEEKSVGDQIGCDVASSTHHAVSRTIFQQVHHAVHSYISQGNVLLGWRWTRL